jgi:hypothetical protein
MQVTAAQIKAEMEKTLRWLVPIANNTTKAHHGFGWVGEWANTGLVSNFIQLQHIKWLKLRVLMHDVYYLMQVRSELQTNRTNGPDPN